MKLFGRRTEYIDEVTAYEHGRRTAHRTVEGPFELNTACLCEPTGDACRTTVVAECAEPDGSSALPPEVDSTSTRTRRR